MRRQDEVDLFNRLRAQRPLPYKAIGSDVAQHAMEDLGINVKRGYGLLDKWCRNGWIDYGVCLPGWFTPEAPSAIGQ